MSVILPNFGNGDNNTREYMMKREKKLFPKILSSPPPHHISEDHSFCLIQKI